MTAAMLDDLDQAIAAANDLTIPAAWCRQRGRMTRPDFIQTINWLQGAASRRTWPATRRARGGELGAVIADMDASFRQSATA